MNERCVFDVDMETSQYFDDLLVLCMFGRDETDERLVFFLMIGNLTMYDAYDIVLLVRLAFVFLHNIPESVLAHFLFFYR